MNSSDPKSILDEVMISPRRGRSDHEMGPDTIMVMIPTELDYLVHLTGAKKLPKKGLELYSLYQTDVGPYGSVTFGGPFLGAPQAVMAMEKMIALGAIRIWVLGYCGSLQEHVRIGDFVIPVSALSEEGTSTHYPIGERIPQTDKALNLLFEDALCRRDHPFHKGRVWTTDAPYRETRKKVQTYKEKGILAVEMEMSALMTLGIFRGVKVAALLVVSDELFNLKWNPGFSDPRLKKGSQLAGDLILEVIHSSDPNEF